MLSALVAGVAILPGIGDKETLRAAPVPTGRPWRSVEWHGGPSISREAAILGVAAWKGRLYVAYSEASTARLVSTNGETWQVADGGAVPWAARSWLSLTATETRLLAFESSPDGWRTWSTADGSNWSSARPSGFEPRGDVQIVAGPTGLFANSGTWHAWSRDGSAWQPVALPGPTAPGRYEVFANEILATRDRFVAVGSVGRIDITDQVEQPAAWWSVDGRTWQPAGVNSDLGRGGYVDMVWHGVDGFRAAGITEAGWPEVPNRAAAFWASSDGRNWARVDSVAVASLASAFRSEGVAFSYDFREGIRRTTDGMEWTSFATEAPGEGAIVAADPTMLVVRVQDAGVDRLWVARGRP